MDTIRKAEVIVFVAICVMGGGLFVSAVSIPKYWTLVQHWTGDSIGDLRLGPTDFKNGTTYHIVMSFTPKWITDFGSNKSYFYLEDGNGNKVTAVYDWSVDLSVNAGTIEKEYSITIGKDIIKGVILWVTPYHGGYDIRIESLAAVIDAASITQAP